MSVEHIIVELSKFKREYNPSEETLAKRLPAGNFEEEALGILSAPTKRIDRKTNNVIDILVELHNDERREYDCEEGRYNMLYLPLNNGFASYAIEVWRDSTRMAKLEFSFGPKFLVVEEFINYSRQGDYYSKIMKDVARICRNAYIETIYFLPHYMKGDLRQPDTS